MEKSWWSITSEYMGWTREQFLFTYNESEKQENNFNKFVVEQEKKWWSYFVIEQQQLALWFSEAEAIMYNFVDWYTKAWKYFWFSTQDICDKLYWWKDKVINTIKSLEKKWYITREKWKDRFWNERRFLSSTTKYSLELLKLRGVSENQIGGIWKSDRGVSENPTHSIIDSTINSNLSSEGEKNLQTTQSSEGEKDTHTPSSTKKEWTPPTPPQLLEAYENEKSLVQMIWNSKAVLERAEYKQSKKSRAYKTVSWFIQQLYGKVDTVRFWEVRWDTGTRFEYAVNKTKENEWKDIYRTEKEEREYQFYKKSLYLKKQENE